MDHLSSLGLDALPEQSTRLTSHPGVLQALDSHLDGRLGFNLCCHCGEENTSFSCPMCHRVRYCSPDCYQKDSRICHVDTAIGHSPIICSLLKTCQEDDDEIHHPHTGATGEHSTAKYRLQTELESYPATLWNILADSPKWFWIKMLHHVRRQQSQRTRDPIPAPHRPSRTLVIHIVGASTDSELGNCQTSSPMLQAYAEAATNFIKHLPPSLILDSLQLVFIGPECPVISTKLAIPDSTIVLQIEAHCGNYEQQSPMIAPPHVLVFFNPGFSCPDYDWSGALAKAASYSTLPFFLATNTEMEGLADIQWLLEGGYLEARALPKDILEAVEHSQQEREEEKTFFFFENPYHGLRVRQSGTMANDLYVKNHWIVGGLLFQSTTLAGTPTHGKRSHCEKHPNNIPKKHCTGRKEAGRKNSKKDNPALV